MPFIDREAFIILLNKLGSRNDDEALTAARAVHAHVTEAGVAWDTLLAHTDESAEDDGDDAPGHVHAGAVDDSMTEPGAAPGDTAGDLATIERLLSSAGLSADTRDILAGMKEDLREGQFSAADRRYLQSLQARLSAAAKN